MVKIVDKQNIFNSGIISTKLHSRDDLKQYNNGIADGLNFICSRYGPMEKRVGTNFVWDLGNPGEGVFFLPFIFSIEQALLLEFLDKKIRFYTFDGLEFGPIVDPGFTWVSPDNVVVFADKENPQVGDKLYSDRKLTEESEVGAITEVSENTVKIGDISYTRKSVQYEITTPFTAEQIIDLSYVQSLDVIYLAFADGKTPPYKLSRYANNNWELAEFITEDGPYLDQNYDSQKKITIKDKNTTTSTLELTNFGLTEADIGRWIRVNTPRYNENTYEYEDRWSYGKIKSITSSTAPVKITVDWNYRSFVDETDNNWMTTATSEWRLGVWHTASGNSDYPVAYPTKVAIHQQRLVWGGIVNKPWIWTSNSFAYTNYAPSDYEGVISDTNAIYSDISTDKVSDIFWIKSLKSLLIGTELGELRMYSAGSAITPSDVVTNRESSYGSYNGEPIVTDDMIIFIQRLQRTLRSLTYDYNYDAYVGPELTILAEHLTAGGIKKIVYQKEPNNTIWCLKEDGELLTLTYDKSQDVIGWARCRIAGEDTKVMDMTVLPSKIYQQDMVMFALERTINGERKRYLELLSKNFNDDVAPSDATFLDCSIRITSEEEFDTISGLDHLEGQTVRVIEQGAYQGDYTVENGEILLDADVTDVLVGLPYEAYFDTLERDFQDKQLSTKMSKLRVYKLKLYLVRTLGLTVQRLETGRVTTLVTFDPSRETDIPPEPVTGKMDIEVSSAWDCDYRLRLKSEPGLPCIVSGIIIGLEINAI